MISTNIEKALNAQINAEFWSAYLYLSMSCRFASDNYKGIANWFKNPAPRGDGPCIYDDRLSRAPGRKGYARTHRRRA